jgi:PDZ domain-containing protein
VAPHVTRQTWTALVAAVVFVALAAMIAAVPVPFVSWSPGGAQDTLGATGGKPVIEVQGIESYPTSGRLDLTTVAVTRAESHVTLPEAVLSYWLPHRDALPRASVYAPGRTAEQVNSDEANLMVTAQDEAVVAALRAAGQPVTEMPAVASVTVGGPAQNRLLPGDLVVSVDGRTDLDEDSVGKQIRSHRIGQTVDFVVLRDRVRQQVSVVTAASTTAVDTPVVGITVGVGYRYEPRISFELGQEIGGPSAGLVFALAIYDKITDGQLLGGRHVAGTGEINPNGDVGSIGGIQEKIAAAAKAGASAFLVPATNCKDVVGMKTDLTLIKVGTLEDAIESMRMLNTPGGADRTPRC